MILPGPLARPESFEIVTERLRLLPHDPSLAGAIADYHLRNHAHFAPFSPLRAAAFHEIPAWRQRAAELRHSTLSGDALQLLLFRLDADAPRVVGNVNVTNVVRGVFQAGYLGYQLDQELVGQGFMREALRATIAHLFVPGGLHRLMANYLPGNARSARLLAGLGFHVEGYARDYLFVDGRWQDHVLTSLTNPNFEMGG